MVKTNRTNGKTVIYKTMYTHNTEDHNTNLTRNRWWTHVLQKGKQLVLYKCSTSDIRLVTFATNSVISKILVNRPYGIMIHL